MVRRTSNDLHPYLEVKIDAPTALTGIGIATNSASISIANCSSILVFEFIFFLPLSLFFSFILFDLRLHPAQEDEGDTARWAPFYIDSSFAYKDFLKLLIYYHSFHKS